MGHDAVLNLDLPERDLIMCLGEFLEIVRAMHQRIVIPLRDPGFEQMQHDSRVFGVVLIPRVVDGITRARYGERRNQTQLDAALDQIISQWAMVIARSLKPNTHWCLKGVKPIA